MFFMKKHHRTRHNPFVSDRQLSEMEHVVGAGVTRASKINCRKILKWQGRSTPIAPISPPIERMQFWVKMSLGSEIVRFGKSWSKQETVDFSIVNRYYWWWNQGDPSTPSCFFGPLKINGKNLGSELIFTCSEPVRCHHSTPLRALCGEMRSVKCEHYRVSETWGTMGFCSDHLVSCPSCVVAGGGRSCKLFHIKK